MKEIIKGWLIKHNIANETEKIIVACSGGPDSIALLHVLVELNTEFKLQIIAAHVNHGFRGQESDGDALYVKNMAEKLKIDHYEIFIDVPAYIKSSGLSTQEASRKLRYEYLYGLVDKLGNAKLAIAHNKNDQAETVLLNILRGTGLSGLSGIKEITGDIIRPFLNVERSQIEEYCRSHELKPRIDSSNLKAKYKRNKIRLELIPYLKENFNENITETLCRLSNMAITDNQYIYETALEIYTKYVTIVNDDYSIPIDIVFKNHLAIQRALLRIIIEKKCHSLKGITFSHVEQIIDVLKNSTVGKSVELPHNLIAVKDYNKLYIKYKENNIKLQENVDIKILTIPGSTKLNRQNIILDANVLGSEELEEKYDAILDYDKVVLPLTARYRIPGDSYQPVGLKGTKKLKEYFIDQKIPQKERDNIPIICDKIGIIWVAGYRVAERVKVAKNSKRILMFKLNIQEEKLW